MKLSQILNFLGPDFITQCLNDRLRLSAANPQRQTRDTSRLVATLLLEDADLPQRLRNATADHLLSEEIIQGVIEFLLLEADVKQRPRALKLATNFGRKPTIAANAPVALDTLTDSQRVAFRELCALSEIYFTGGGICECVTLRIAPLIIGPSGVGKTHVVTMVGRVLGLPVIRMTVGDWIIHAARQPPSAFDTLQHNLNQHDRMILFVDELDKLSLTYRSGEYTRAQHAEIYAALDRSISFCGSRNNPWTDEHAEKLRRNVMIVGGGTWHDLWVDAERRPFGFGQTADAVDDITKRILQARIIPDELLNRFSDRWLLLRPYTVEDFRDMAARLSLAPEDFDPVAAVASGRNFRAVQNALTAQALKRYYAEKSANWL